MFIDTLSNLNQFFLQKFTILHILSGFTAGSRKKNFSQQILEINF